MAVTANQGPSSSSEGVRPACSDLAAPSSSSSSGLAAPSLSSDPINHKRAAGSCSGAGLWLSTGSPSAVADIVPAAGTSSSEVSSAPPASSSSSPPPSDDFVLDKDSQSPRTYHFPAGIVAAGARSSGIGKQQQQWELMSAGLSTTTTDMVRPSSSSDRVDLDLSFDFLSDNEDNDEGLSRAAPVVVSPTPAMTEVAIFIPPVLAAAEAGSSRPRGMAESMSRSNSRKKPPKPLAFLKKVSSAGLKSTFSPETPSIVIRPAEDEEDYAPLPTTPLSATRRANDSNIQPSGSSSGAIVRRRARTLSDAQPPPSSPPTTPLPPLPMAAFANLSSAIKKPKSTSHLQQSYVPFPTSAELDAATAASSQPLSNGKPAPRTLRKPLRNSASSSAVLDHQPLSAPLDSSSCAMAEPSDAPPRKPLRQKLFGRSSSSSIDKLASYLSSSPSTELSGGGGNSLGLDLGRPSATPSPQSGEEATTTSSEFSPSSSRPGGLSLIIAALPLPATGGEPSAASPLNSALSPASKNHSSPETPLSSMFDSRDTRSDWSKATSDVAGTPKSTSFPMQKGPSGTGASASALMTGVIFEEPLEELRQANGGQSGMTRSETAEWIRAQQEAAAASQASGGGSGSAQRSSTSSSAGSSSSAEVFAPAAEELPSVAPLNIVKGASVPAPSSPPRELPKSESIAGLGLFFDAKDTAAPVAPARLNSVLTIGEQRTDSSGATSPDVLEVRRVALDMPRPPPSALLFNEPEGKHLLVRHNSDDAASASERASFGVVEPFAHNATRPSTGKGQQGGSNARSVTDPVGRPRFGSRLWSSLYSGKRDSSTVATPAAAHAPLRSLTLVRLQERQEGLPASRRHSVGQTAADGDESQDSLHVIGQALIDPPNTAPLPSVEFPSATAVPTTFERSKRSSKHVRRSSTIKYNPSRRADETRLNIGSQSSELVQTEFSDSTSPRVAEGYTPDMVYGTSGRRSRLSWGYNPPTPKTDSPAQADSSLTHGDVEADSSRLSAGSRATTPTSPFLDFEEDGRGLQATRDRTRSLLAQRQQQQQQQQQQQGSESMEFSQGGLSSSAFDSDGLRRRPTTSESQRYSHRSSYSTPPVAATASVRPFLSRVDRRASLHADVTINQGGRLGHINEGTGLRKLHLAGDLPSAEEAARPMSIYVPLEKLQAHMRQQYQQEAAKRVAERSTQRRKTLMMGGGNNALTFASNRLLDVDSPARALFFAGFLAMPWLWVIGGWWLTNDGTMTVSEQDDRVRFYTHEASMVAAREQSRREQTPSPRLQQQGRFERDHYHQRGPASTVTRTDGAATSSAWPDLYATDYSMSAQTHTGDAISSSQSSSNESRSIESDVDDTSEPSLVTDHRRSGYTSGTAAARTNRQSAYTWSARSSGVTGTHDALSRAHSAASSRVLVSSNPNRISRGVRRSIGTLLNPHPEIALFHSPVRTISMDEGATTAEYAGFTATDSRSRLSHSSSSSEDHHRRSRAGERQQDRRQKRMPLGLDDSGLDLITDIDEEDEEGSTLNDDDDTDDIHAAYQRQQNYNDDHAEVDQRYSTCGSYAAATQVKLTFAESLALIDRFVLMNRVMSIVSTCVVFAGVGLALNVVVENF